MSVDWVKFTGVATVPADFRLSGKLIGAKLSLTYVDCPPISDEVIENMRNPRRNEYPLAAATTAAAER